MPNIKDEILKEFDNKFGLSGLESNHDNFYKQDEYDKVRDFLSQSLDRYLSEALKLMPKLEEHGCGFNDGDCECECFKKCRDQFIENLRNNNLIN